MGRCVKVSGFINFRVPRFVGIYTVRISGFLTVYTYMTTTLGTFMMPWLTS